MDHIGSAKPNIPGMSILVLHHFLFPSFLNPKTTKIQEFGQNKTPPFAKESSKCYQCLSGFKYCSSPEISSSALVIQDQGALAFDLCSWESSSRSKPKSRRGVSTDHWLKVTKLRKVALEVWQCWTKLWSLTVSVKLRASLLQYRECIKQLFWAIHPTPWLHSEWLFVWLKNSRPLGF